MRFALASLCCLSCAASAGAQQFPYEARAAADGVTVHAGPADGDYVTATLPRGAAVTVVRHDPGGKALVRPPAGAFSLAKRSWLNLTAGTFEAGGTAVVTAEGAELYCRVGSRTGETPLIEQVPLRSGQAVTVLGAVTLPGADGPEAWAKIPSPAGEHRWCSLRHLVPADRADRDARDLDPYAVPTALLEEAKAAATGGGVELAAATDPFAPPPAEAFGAGPVEMAFAPPRPLTQTAAAPALTASSDPFAPPSAGVTPAAAAAPGGERGWLEDPTPADRFAPAGRGAEAVTLDRRRLDELDGRLDAVLDADPERWDLDQLASDLRDLRDRAGSKAVRRLAAARLERVEALRVVRRKYHEYVELTAATDKRDAVLTAEAAETLKRFAEIVPTFGPSETVIGAGPLPYDAAPPMTATLPGHEYEIPTSSAPALAAPGTIDRMSHTRPAPAAAGAGEKPAAFAPPGSVAFEAVGELRAVTNPPHAQCPAFALVGPDGGVTAYLRDDARLKLSARVGARFGVNGRRFRHPAIAAPMIAVSRLVPVAE